jgi:hypothetical protein
MLPAQFPINITALTVVLLVYPATLEAIILKVMGIPAEYAGKSHIPASRATLLLGSIRATMRQPARLMSDKVAMVMHRDFRTLEVIIVAKTTHAKVKTDMGKETRRVLKVEYPNPAITMPPNCGTATIVSRAS